jgi:hypothetical protein
LFAVFSLAKHRVFVGVPQPTDNLERVALILEFTLKVIFLETMKWCRDFEGVGLRG